MKVCKFHKIGSWLTLRYLEEKDCSRNLAKRSNEKKCFLFPFLVGFCFRTFQNQFFTFCISEVFILLLLHNRNRMETLHRESGLKLECNDNHFKK